MSLVKWDLTNVGISLWWWLKSVLITLLLWKESDLFVRIKSIVDLCVFVMQGSFLIKDCRLNKLQNYSNLSWSLFEIPISILRSPMTIKFLYDSLAFLSDSDNSLKKYYILRIGWSIDTKADPFYIRNS